MSKILQEERDYIEAIKNATAKNRDDIKTHSMDYTPSDEEVFLDAIKDLTNKVNTEVIDFRHPALDEIDEIGDVIRKCPWLNERFIGIFGADWANYTPSAIKKSISDFLTATGNALYEFYADLFSKDKNGNVPPEFQVAKDLNNYDMNVTLITDMLSRVSSFNELNTCLNNVCGVSFLDMTLDVDHMLVDMGIVKGKMSIDKDSLLHFQPENDAVGKQRVSQAQRYMKIGMNKVTNELIRTTKNPDITKQMGLLGQVSPIYTV